MEVFELSTMQRTEIKENTIVALGTFDGCHLGHGSVFQNAFYESKKRGVKSVVYTFDGLVRQDKKALFTLEERIKHIKKCGIDYIAIESFEKIKNMSGERFFDSILKGKLKSIGACCGFNYRFGVGASLGCEELKMLYEKSGGSVVISPEITADNMVISSTHLRKLIENGEVELASKYMPPYPVYAEVVQGKRLGRQMGFPTINQKIPENKVVPRHGVYITEAYIGENAMPAITNVGTRPTVDGENKNINMETYILDFDGNLYLSYVNIVFRKFLRSERKFDSVNELKEQISKDLIEARKYFK